jgi:hypothetical protein
MSLDLVNAAVGRSRWSALHNPNDAIRHVLAELKYFSVLAQYLTRT